MLSMAAAHNLDHVAVGVLHINERAAIVSTMDGVSMGTPQFFKSSVSTLNCSAGKTR